MINSKISYLLTIGHEAKYEHKPQAQAYHLIKLRISTYEY